VGDHPKAIEHQAAALAIAREIGNLKLEGNNLNILTN
jgi:hypothetical protein